MTRWILECRDPKVAPHSLPQKLYWVGAEGKSLGAVWGAAVEDDPCWRADHHARHWRAGDPDVTGPAVA